MSVDIRVRGYHLDIYQHVNNARYLEFLEEARWQFIMDNSLDISAQELGVAFVIVNINANFRKPALIHDLLRVSVRIKHIGNKSAQFEQIITKIENGVETDCVLDAIITFCFMDVETEKAISIEGKLREVLSALNND